MSSSLRRVVILGVLGVAGAYTPAVSPKSRVAAACSTAPPSALSRRAALAGAAAAGVAASWPLGAQAAQDTKDLTRLVKGLKDITFLLDNWDQETIDPTTGKDSPDRVRYFLGLRTTDHPLFQVEKLLVTAQDRINDDDFEKWVAASEGFNSACAKVNELAYTSSFGEYNPGGGAALVRKYLLLAKEEVVVAQTSLTTMIELLKL